MDPMWWRWWRRQTSFLNKCVFRSQTLTSTWTQTGFEPILLPLLLMAMFGCQPTSMFVWLSVCRFDHCRFTLSLLLCGAYRTVCRPSYHRYSIQLLAPILLPKFDCRFVGFFTPLFRWGSTGKSFSLSISTLRFTYGYADNS